jgi:hypothetical protein
VPTHKASSMGLAAVFEIVMRGGRGTAALRGRLGGSLALPFALVRAGALKRCPNSCGSSYAVAVGASVARCLSLIYSASLKHSDDQDH